MMKLSKLALLASLATTAHAAVAIEACERHQTSYERTLCTAKLFVDSDNELNAEYKKLRKFTKGKTDSALVQTQRDWIQYRTESCETTPAPQVGCGARGWGCDGDATLSIADMDCGYRLTRERTEYLRTRARECAAGVCDAAAVTRPSW